MLGLIQKDIYQMLKYQRVLMLIVIAFAATCAWNLDNAFFMVYPSVISAMSVVTLQSYDERSGFTCYSRVMPISIKTIVGEKYICGAGLILLVCLIEAPLSWCFIILWWIPFRRLALSLQWVC